MADHQRPRWSSQQNRENDPFPRRTYLATSAVLMAHTVPGCYGVAVLGAVPICTAGAPGRAVAPPNRYWRATPFSELAPESMATPACALSHNAGRLRVADTAFDDGQVFLRLLTADEVESFTNRGNGRCPASHEGVGHDAPRRGQQVDESGHDCNRFHRGVDVGAFGLAACAYRGRLA